MHLCKEGSDCVPVETSDMTTVCSITGRELTDGMVIYEKPSDQILTEKCLTMKQNKVPKRKKNRKIKCMESSALKPNLPHFPTERDFLNLFFDIGEIPHDNFFCDLLRKPQCHNNFLVLDKGIFHILPFSDECRYKFYTVVSNAFRKRDNLHAKNEDIMCALKLALQQQLENVSTSNKKSTNGLRNLDGLKKFFQNHIYTFKYSIK